MDSIEQAIIELLIGAQIPEHLGIAPEAIRVMADQSGDAPGKAAIIVETTQLAPYPGTVPGAGVYEGIYQVHLMTHLDEDANSALMDLGTLLVGQALDTIAGDVGGYWVDYCLVSRGQLVIAEPYRTRSWTLTMYIQEAI
jgi:hypothetical protein